MELFDTHCHLDATVFDKDRKLLLEKSFENGIRNILLPGTTKESWRLIRMHVALTPGLHAALGLHPMFIEKHTEQHLHDLELALNLPPISAVGEIGLDYYDKTIDREKQQLFFRAQVKLAKEKHLPIILHVRKAHDVVLKYIRLLQFEEGGIVHAFSGSLQQAHQFSKLGFVVGLGGALTHERAKAMHRLVCELDDNQFVLETDAPDMRPAFALDVPNTPLNVPEIAKYVAELRKTSLESIYELTSQNFERVVGG